MNELESTVSNIMAESLIESGVGGCFLDSKNIVWKLIDGEWIGKRSVWTLDWRACWLENTTIDNVEIWWCGGKDADYTEIFYRT